MTRQDWTTAGVTALGVAALTAALFAQPLCWAKDTVKVTVPALPNTQLALPTLKAQVAATTTPAPGKDVHVLLTMKSPARTEAAVVPVTVTVLRTEMSPMARSMPIPERVTETQTSLPINKDGIGAALVTLPLQWALPAKPQAETPKPANDKAPAIRLPESTVTFQLVLSATVSGKTVCSEPQVMAMVTAREKRIAQQPRRPLQVRVVNLYASAKPVPGQLVASAKK